MTSNIVATSSGALSRINEAIHDYWFRADEIVFDPGANALTIRFMRPRLDVGERAGCLFTALRAGDSHFESFLRVYDVRACRIDDRERVESYDFNEVEYDPGKGTLRVTTGVPIAIEMDVVRLNVCVEVTDTVIKRVR